MGASRNGHWIWIFCLVCFGLLEAMSSEGKPPTSAVTTATPPQIPTAAPQSNSPPAATTRPYTVQANDGWQHIARVNHVDEQALLDANGATEETRIDPGQILRVPVSNAPIPVEALRPASPTTAQTPKKSNAAAHAALSTASSSDDSAPSFQAVPSPQQTYVLPPSGAGGYGEISKTTGLPRTDYVSGYTRKDGTYVAPYYRSHR